MTKYKLIIAIFLITSGIASAQQALHIEEQFISISTSYVDSLKNEAQKTRSNEERANHYLSIANVYRHMNSDSSILYAEKSIELANPVSQSYMVNNATGAIVDGLIYKGNLPKALELALKSISTESDQPLGESGKGSTYYALGDIYNHLEDYDKAKSYFNQLIRMKGKDVVGVPFGHFQLANTYEQLNQLDSALFHLRESYSLMKDLEMYRNSDVYPPWYNIRAKVYLKQSKIELAKADLFKTLSITANSNEFFHTSNTYNDLAYLFQSIGQRDSSIYYAEQGVAVAENAGYVRGLLKGSALLAELYENNNPQRALDYYKLSSQAKEQLYSAGDIQVMRDIINQDQKRQDELAQSQLAFENRLILFSLIIGLTSLAIIAFLLFKNNRRKEKSNKELESQKEEISKQKEKAESTLSVLKSTQSQLIQSEKMASLGELTAGIAHEIQNPLNFVNNFSEVNTELIDELVEEIKEGRYDDVLELATDIKSNEEKIKHHGSRADSIVKGMLKHSRTNSGEKTPTDINAICDEYLRLAYHGLRAKDNTFNAKLETDFDESIGDINVVAQDISRVILNLITNAFQALTYPEGSQGADRSVSTATSAQPQSASGGDSARHDYKPVVSITTKQLNNFATITIKDNGSGIPDAIKDKIFQPFFTTKPTGQGTGLGLSLAYDIVKAHGGELKVESEEGKGTAFIIELPVV